MTEQLPLRKRLRDRLPTRGVSRAVATAALGAGMVVVPFGGSPAHAACSPTGNVGWDSSLVAPGVYEYSLIAYYGSGCTVGVVDMEAVAVPGTPATCTFILPVLPTLTDGTGCANLLGVGGVVTAAGSITAVANGFVSDGTHTYPIVKTCTGSGSSGKRC
jgi:hypothetical protein